METKKGVSGAPILEFLNEKFFIRAIHVGSAEKILPGTKVALKLTK
jgi:hypothetical protein